jgi:hypothetical protein
MDTNANMPLFMFLSFGAIALFSFAAVAAWATGRRREREAFYKSETIKKIAETQGPGANAALEFMREQEKNAARNNRERLKLGGLGATAVGLALMVFLWFIERNEPVFLAGLFPLFVGLVQLAYVYLLAPKE